MNSWFWEDGEIDLDLLPYDVDSEERAEGVLFGLFLHHEGYGDFSPTVQLGSEKRTQKPDEMQQHLLAGQMLKW